MPLLQYDISVVGMPAIDRALAGIERRLVEHNRRVVGMANRTAGAAAARGLGSRRSVPGGPSSFDKEAQAAARAAASLDRQRSQALWREHQLKERLAHREAARAKRLDDQAHRRRIHSAEAEARKQARLAEQTRREFRHRTGGVIGAGISSVGSVGATALGAVGLASGALIGSKIGPAVALDKAQRALLTAGHGAGEKSPYTLQQIQGITNATSMKTGASQADVVAGMREYVAATGDLKGAVAAIESFGTIATAAEASIADVAKAGAYLSTAMGVTAKEMPEALSALYFGGKKGSFELADFAAAVPELGTMAKGLGMSGMEGVKTLSGLSQIAMKGTGNAAEAQTALANLFRQTVAKSDDIQTGKAFGGRKVEVFNKGDPTAGFKDYRQTLADMVVASRGNIVQLNDFAEIRGSKALNPLVNAYKDATDKLGPNASQKQKDEAGKKAVLAMIKDNSEAPGNFKDVQKDAKEVMESFQSQLDQLNTKTLAIVQRDLLPALVRLMPHLEKLTPHFGKLVDAIAKAIDTFAKNPMGNVGEIIATKVAYDIASAAIGPRIRDALTNALTGSDGTKSGGGKGGVTGFFGGGESTGAKILANAMAAMVIYQLSVETVKVGKLLIDQWMPSNKEKVEKDIDRFNKENEAMRGGGDVQARVDILKGLLDDAKGRLGQEFKSEDPIVRLVQMFGAKPIEGGRDRLSVEKQKADADLKATIDRLSKEIATLSKSIPREAAPNRGNSPSPVKS